MTVRKGVFPALIGLSALLYYVIGYHIPRYEHVPLISSYLALFLLYRLMYRFHRQHPNLHRFSTWLTGALLIRLVLIACVPALSDDVFRFIWDGRLWAAGIHPFSYTPDQIMGQGGELPPGINQELYVLLNSQSHYTIYPPVAQFIFFLAGIFFPDSVPASIILIRVFILLMEIGSLLLLPRLLNQFNLPLSNWVLYAFNPLVVLELTGNLHFEAGVILFLFLSIFYLHKRYALGAGISFALSVASKLIPLLFAPLIFRYMNLRRSVIFFGSAGIILLLLFLPLWSPDLVTGMKDSLGLYFQKFEFNASIYFIVRAFGYLEKGYNIIGTAGPWLARTVLFIVILYTLMVNAAKTPIALSMLWLLFCYLLLSTTVHPWYITPLVALSVLTSYRFPILWSLLIFLTYTGYSREGYSENVWVSLIEYLPVLGVALVEWTRSAYFLELYNKIRTLTR